MKYYYSKEDAYYNGAIFIIFGSIFFLIGLFGANATKGNIDWSSVVIFCGMGGIFILSGITQCIKKYDGSDYSEISQYVQYIEENKTSLGLFARPVYGKSKIILANKFVIIEIDLSCTSNNIFLLDITDKIKKVKHIVKVSSARTYKSYRSFKKLVNNIINYDTVAEDIFYTLNRANMEQSEIKNFVIKDELFLDINQASEAELTALPGVTIAKAKHAIKVRKQQKLFLTMNQFYKEIELDEEFIEQIPIKGNKILLNDLPEYKKLEMKREEN